MLHEPRASHFRLGNSSMILHLCHVGLVNAYMRIRTCMDSSILDIKS